MSDTPRTDAVALDDTIVRESRLLGADRYADMVALARSLEREVIALNDSARRFMEERESNTRQFRRLQERLAQEEADRQFYVDYVEPLRSALFVLMRDAEAACDTTELEPALHQARTAFDAVFNRQLFGTKRVNL